MPPVRLDAVFARVTSPRHSTVPVSDGLPTIDAAEARSLARALEADGVDRTARTQMIERVMREPSLFANERARSVFRTGVGSHPAVESVRLRFEDGEDVGPAEIVAKIGGVERTLGHAATMGSPIQATTVGDRFVVWSDGDGAGGYENEGEALHCYDAVTGRSRRILREYYTITDLRVVEAPNGRHYVIVSMTDGGEGAPHVAIVDPLRGEVYRADRSEVVSADGNGIVIGHYGDDDHFDDPDEADAAVPDSTETLTFAALRGARVIHNPYEGM